MFADSLNFRRSMPQRRGVLITWAAFAVGFATLQGAQAAPAADTVKLVIDYGDGAELHFPALTWRDGITALDVLTLAQKHPHGVKFRHRGTGAHAKVEQIGYLTNQGDGKNWIFSVNGKQGEVSSGIHMLKRGDTVLWKFQIYE
jgi:hypothetical protein